MYGLFAGLLQQLARLEELLDYTFANKYLALEALTHPSFTYVHQPDHIGMDRRLMCMQSYVSI